MDDKVKLTPEQITLLKDFIRKRGFNDALQINEILDHFACKVEEVLTEDNTLNLKQAMQKAHNSFGVMGFHPIAEALGKGLSLKYKQIYWKYVRQLITSPKWILVFMLVFFLWLSTYTSSGQT